jgi:hypothetical protein
MRTGLRNLWLGASILFPVAIGARAHAATAVMTITSITIGPTLGKVASANVSPTVFTITDSTGGIGKTSGNGARITTGGGAIITVTVACSGANCTAGGNGNITAGTNSGRAMAMSNFTVSNGATIGAGATFTVPALNKNQSETFRIGMDFPIAGDDAGGATGAQPSTFVVKIVAGSGGTPTGPVTGVGTVTVERGLTVSKISDLAFGSIIPPSTGSGVVTIADTTGAISSVTGTNAAVLPASRPSASSHPASFVISGEGAETFALAIPASFGMSLGGSSLMVTTSPSLSIGTHTFPTSLGSAQTLPLLIGGSFPLASGTPDGGYTGTFAVVVNYN